MLRFPQTAEALEFTTPLLAVLSGTLIQTTPSSANITGVAWGSQLRPTRVVCSFNGVSGPGQTLKGHSKAHVFKTEQNSTEPPEVQTSGIAAQAFATADQTILSRSTTLVDGGATQIMFDNKEDIHPSHVAEVNTARAQIPIEHQINVSTLFEKLSEAILPKPRIEANNSRVQLRVVGDKWTANTLVRDGLIGQAEWFSPPNDTSTYTSEVRRVT